MLIAILWFIANSCFSSIDFEARNIEKSNEMGLYGLETFIENSGRFNRISILDEITKWTE